MSVWSTNAQTEQCSSTILLDSDYDSTNTDEKMHSEKISILKMMMMMIADDDD